MPENTDGVRPQVLARRPLDGTDRKILGELAVDADVGFAELGQRVALSAPAVHDRVKKMRAAGYIRGKVAVIDAAAIGKPVLAFVLIDTEGWGRSEELMAFGGLPEVEELHSVAGDTSILGKVRCASTSDLEALLARIYAIKGVRGTRTYMTLSTYLERPVQIGITDFGGTTRRSETVRK